MSVTIGTSLGPYEIIAPLGAGGMGQVFKARDTRLGRDVAIKILPPHLASDPTARERLRREAIAAAALDHPFICKVFEISEATIPAAAEPAIFIVMEFVRGETLHARLSSGPIPAAEALAMTVEMVEALEAAHARQIVHRDLKPGNVMISAQGHVKVMDFGLAKDLSIDAERHTQTMAGLAEPLTGRGERVGTPAYMSPEQLIGDTLDARSDIFSLGVMLCEMVSGVHPFHRPTLAGTVSAVLQDPPVIAPSVSTSDVPSAIRQLLHRMLAKTPADRYQSMSEVRRDLAGMTAGSAPLAIPVPSADRVGQTRRWPMVGREHERAELAQRLDDALAGRGSLVMIGGEPGIGKTRLTEAIQDDARRRGCMCLVGHAYGMEGAPPYVPFIEMLEYSARAIPALAFRHALGDSAPEIARLFPELRRIFADIPPPLDVPPDQQRWRLFNAYRDFVVRSCRMTPMVVVLEDLHWADEPTLQLLLHVASAFATLPLLVIGTYRDVELDVARPFAKVLETLIRQRHATRIALRRLPAAGVDELLAVMSGHPAPASLARVIFAETEGNPFFVEEIFQHLREEGRVLTPSGEWRSDLRVETLDVPEGVRLVIGRRLERLSDVTRRVLTTAAVIGRSFSLALLEALEDAGGDVVLEALEDAERAHLLAPQRVGRDTRYLFTHELIRQTLADALSMPRRQRLHARIAAAIERVYAGALDKHVTALAHHLYQAGAGADAEKTTQYLALAADEARAAAAHEDALRLADQALSLWEDERSDRVADLLERRGLALRSLGRPEEAIASLTDAAAMWDAERSPERLGRTAYELASALGWQARPREGAAHVRTALQRLGSAPAAVVAPLKLIIPMWEAAAGEPDALDAFYAAREEFRGEPAERAMASLLEPHLLWFLGEIRQAAESSRATAAHLVAAGMEARAADIEWMSPISALYLGQHAAAGAEIDTVEARATRVGLFGARVVLRQMRAILAIHRGHFDAAFDFIREATDLARQSRSPWGYFPEMTRAFQLVHLGRPDEGLALMREIERSEPDTYWSFLSRSYLFRVLASVRPLEAGPYFDAVKPAVPLARPRNSLGRWTGLSPIVEGLALIGRTAEAAALLPATEALLAKGPVAMGAWTASTRTAAGIAAAAAQNFDLASGYFQSAIEEADAIPLVSSQPAARTWFADMLLRRDAPGDRQRARALLDQAIALCDRHGLVLLGERARAVGAA